MTAAFSIVDDEPIQKAPRRTPAPILLAALKSDTDTDRDHVTARLEHIRAERFREEDAIAALEKQMAVRRDVLARIDSEESELVKVDRILSAAQYGYDGLLVEKR